MKNLQNLRSAQLLSKKEQQSINGGETGNCFFNYEGIEACLSNCAEECIEVAPVGTNCYICQPPEME